MPCARVSVLLSCEVVVTVSQEVDVNGIKFWSYNAGHVLGAAMFMLEIAGVKILYTGDFSCEEDRHLMAAEIPSISPDVLISVSSPLLLYHLPHPHSLPCGDIVLSS